MRFAAFVAALLVSFGALAQAYPSKAIRIVVPFPAGGIADLYARLIGLRIADNWGQPVLVDNRTGAGGNIGADVVAKSSPDGYTLVMGSFGTHAVNVSLFSSMPYDPERDFTPIALVLEAEGLLVVHPSVPAKNVSELIAHARANPGKLTFASAGMGTASHLAGELFKTMARVDMTHVPYKGNVPAITDLLAGQTSLLFGTMPTVLPQAKAGKLRALATIGSARSAAAPDLPTVAQTLPGVRGEQLGRPPRAGAHEPRHRAEVEPRSDQDHARCRHPEAPARRGRAPFAQHAGRIRRLHQVRDCQMGAGGQGVGRSG
jgi:tripartite-type tricarboxylate transporter receptor subunit TctC